MAMVFAVMDPGMYIDYLRIYYDKRLLKEMATLGDEGLRCESEKDVISYNDWHPHKMFARTKIR